MHISTRAIVLQTIKYSESSVICKLFTEQLGVVSYIINGVRSSKGKNKAAILQPLTILEIEVSQRENKQLQRLTEYRRAVNFQSILFDVRKSSVAVFIIEVLGKTISTNEPHPEIFNLTVDCLVHLDKMEVLNPDFHLIYLLSLSGHLGFQPQGQFSEQTPYFNLREGYFCNAVVETQSLATKENSKCISLLLRADVLQDSVIITDRSYRKQVLHCLLQYYRHHIEDMAGIKSLDVLEAVFG